MDYIEFGDTVKKVANSLVGKEDDITYEYSGNSNESNGTYHQYVFQSRKGFVKGISIDEDLMTDKFAVLTACEIAEMFIHL